MTANPNASDDAKRLLNWLADLPKRGDKRVVCGQQICCGWDLSAAYNTYITALWNETGKYPAMLGADLAYGDWSEFGQNSTLIDYWNNGGLITLNWHAWNPWTGNGLEWTGGSASDRNIGDMADLYTPGNDAYDMWHADMDRKAGWLDELQDAGVVVLWRPFHEMNGCWTWWACRDQAEFINLWRHMFDYFTDTKGLNNLLWVYAPNRLPCSYAPEYYYPGDDYVDIVGLDYYLDTGGLDLIDERGRPELLALGKPFALTEFGPTGWYVGDDPPEHIPSINSYDYGSLMDKIRELCPEVVYFQAWGENYSLINQLGAQGLLNDPWVITRDEVDWKEGGGTEMATLQEELTGLDEKLVALGALDIVGMVERLDVIIAELTTIRTDLSALSIVNTSELRAHVTNAKEQLAACDAAVKATLGI